MTPFSRETIGEPIGARMKNEWPAMRSAQTPAIGFP